MKTCKTSIDKKHKFWKLIQDMLLLLPRSQTNYNIHMDRLKQNQKLYYLKKNIEKFTYWVNFTKYYNGYSKDTNFPAMIPRPNQQQKCPASKQPTATTSDLITWHELPRLTHCACVEHISTNTTTKLPSLSYTITAT